MVSPFEGGRVTATSCASVNAFSTFQDLVEGNFYDFEHSSPFSDGYITLTDAANQVLMHGPSPLRYQATFSGDVRLHYSNDGLCTASPGGCRTGRATTRLAKFFSDRFEVTDTPVVVLSVDISPNPAFTDDTLSCSATVSDPDDDQIALSYSWFVEGTAAGNEPTLSPGAFSRGQTVRCEVTPSDGTDVGEPYSDVITIRNSPPVVNSVSISPDPAFTDDTLSCSATVSDADDDEVALSYAWFVEGAAAGNEPILPPDAFSRDQTVSCEVTPFDGSEAGEPAQATIIISNSPPVISNVFISPNPAFTNNTLSCIASASDPDGEPLTFSYSWTVDGTPAGGNQSTLPSSAFLRDQTVRCEVTPFDAIEAGEPAQATIIIANSPPVVTNVTISPNPAFTNDTLSCSASAADADGDTISFSYSWTVDGAPAGDNQPTLPPSAFEENQAVRCTVRPNDGIDDGAPGHDQVIISS